MRTPVSDASARCTAGLATPYTHLIGLEDGRARLPTPCLVVDEGALTRNIDRMARFAVGAGMRLRPHVKTHKCGEIARRQVAAGADGVCCATLDEVEAMAGAGLRGLLLTSAIVTEDKLERYVEVLKAAPDTLLVLDDPAVADRLASLAAAGGVEAGVLVDLDIGYHRSGVRTREQAQAVTRRILASPVLKLKGIQAYSGAIQHQPDLRERAALLGQQMRALQALLADIEALAGPVAIRSGGGTGTHELDAREGIFTELQAGSYVFMDADYARIDLGKAADEAFETALRLRATVIGTHCAASSPAESFVVIDAGTKSFALNGPAPVCLTAPWQGAGFRFMGDEHAHLLLPPGCPPPGIGEALEFQVSHCDPTVHHFDHLYVVGGDAVTAIWPVDARGRR